MNFLKIFHDIDTDYSGKISVKELEAYMRRDQESFEESFVDIWMELFEVDETGEITIEAYCDKFGLTPCDDYLTKVERRRSVDTSSSEKVGESGRDKNRTGSKTKNKNSGFNDKKRNDRISEESDEHSEAGKHEKGGRGDGKHPAGDKKQKERHERDNKKHHDKNKDKHDEQDKKRGSSSILKKHTLTVLARDKELDDQLFNYIVSACKESVLRFGQTDARDISANANRSRDNNAYRSGQDHANICETDMATFIKVCLDRQVWPAWHVVVSRFQFGCCMSHEGGYFLHILWNRFSFQMWRTPCHD